ncbi:MAG: hypothetical protein LQ347_006510, partial [Umbilicaria vellea]
MPANIGLQISLELSKILPIRSVIDTVGSQILKLARDLRLSGSDLVVEEDLAEVFGRGQINPEFEAKFKDVVKIQNFVPLSKGSVISLESGPGPTMLHAFRDKRYFAMVIQMSLLAWMHRREDLASMLSQVMTERFEMGVPGASSSPGVDGIIMTFAACSSQSSAFPWAHYVELVESQFRGSIINYYYHSDHLRLTRPVLLAAIDYLYLVQRFPEDRKITVSSAAGSITLIIWAHYILGLTVAVVEPASETNLVFGDQQSPHMIITWPLNTIGDENYLEWDAGRVDIQPEIRLLDSKMTVVLESTQEAEGGRGIHAEERHPLANYGITFLKRLFNTVMIISDKDPIYEESAKWATAMAIHADRRLDRQISFSESDDNSGISREPLPAASVEIWRILASARLIFADTALDSGGIDSYARFLRESTLDEDNFPSTFNAFLKRVPVDHDDSPAAKHLFNIKHLAAVILVFAHVSEVESCADLPILFVSPTDLSISRVINNGPVERSELSARSVFDAVQSFLVGSDYLDEYSCQDSFLRSEFGWSVFLVTVGDKDPGIVRPELVHIKRGTPTNTKTKERKLRMKDSLGAVLKGIPEGQPLLRGLEYLPRLAARVNRLSGRQEYWTTRAQDFEACVFVSVEPSPEWRQHSGISPWQEVIHYGYMQNHLWDSFTTPCCDHPRTSNPEPIKLGPDAATLLGFSPYGE